MRKQFLFLVFLTLLIPITSYSLTLPASHYAKGLIKPNNWEEKAQYITLLKSEPVPSHFDWREKLGKEVPVRDQGSCGSCWAFSRTTTLNWQILIQAGDAVQFSPQELVSCDKDQIGCNGGYWDNYELKGISYENEFPYKASDLSCKSGLSRKQKIDSWLYIGGKGRSPTKDEMKQAIFQYGPIGVTVSASGSFPSGCGNGQTNHMVVITGWDEPKGGWYMQNSWGVSWGDKGYSIIKYGCYRIGEEAAISILNVQPPKPVTFILENKSVTITTTLQPGTTYGVEGAKKALKNAINSVGVQ